MAARGRQVGLAFTSCDNAPRHILSSDTGNVCIRGSYHPRSRGIVYSAIPYFSPIDITERRDTIETAVGDSSIALDSDTNDVARTTNILEEGDITVICDAWLTGSMGGITEVSNKIVYWRGSWR